MKLRVLLVDDEPDIYLAAGEALRDAGHHVDVAHDGVEALALVSAGTFDVMVCDVRLPKLDGLSLFRKSRELSPHTAVILVTGFVEVRDAVAAVRDGVHDYLTKPLATAELLVRIGRVGEQIALARELSEAHARLAQLDESETIIGRSPVMCRLRDRLNTIASSDASVLITGETGTGKELVARALHDRGPRRSKPFVAINCAAFPDTLLEAELFGYERGAFTGAVGRRQGRFSAAHGGTLLLDEVGDMSLSAQVKLLRVLQEQTFEPLGGNQSVHVDVRVLSATHRDLRKMMADGSFREDLYYRLNVINVHSPALRDREGDLPLLAQYFMRKFRRPGTGPARMSLAAWTALSAFAFPGNVRQLGHALERATVMAGDAELDIEHLPREIVGDTVAAVTPALALRPLRVASNEFERQYLQRALAECDGKRVDAAKILGISRKNLWEKLRVHDELPA
jgi:two-component system response regulator AtoC